MRNRKSGCIGQGSNRYDTGQRDCRRKWSCLRGLSANLAEPHDSLLCLDYYAIEEPERSFRISGVRCWSDRIRSSSPGPAGMSTNSQLRFLAFVATCHYLAAAPEACRFSEPQDFQPKEIAEIQEPRARQTRRWQLVANGARDLQASRATLQGDGFVIDAEEAKALLGFTFMAI
jgi:hypothetical protein